VGPLQTVAPGPTEAVVLTHPFTTHELIGNMVIQDLKTVAGSIEASGIQPQPAVVAIDEFSGLAGDQVAGLFQRARSQGCR